MQTRQYHDRLTCAASPALCSPFPTRPAWSTSPARWRSTASSWSRPAAPARRWPTPGSRCATSSDLTGFPEMMDGRVKTLHPDGARRPAGDPRQRRARGRDGGARHRADRSPGGQSLSVRGDGREGRRLRHLHREHRHRRPGDDPRRRQEPRRRRGRRRPGRLRARCSPSSSRQQRRDHARAAQEARRQGLCAHRRLRRRDLQLVRRSSSAIRRRPIARSAAGWPRRCATARTRTSRRRSIARGDARPGVATARQVQGKQLSYNNINDTDAAYECVAEFDPKRTAACAIIKHANPCGVAEGASLLDAYRKALRLRSGLGLRRHRGAQPHARRRGRARHHRDLHRGHHRAGRDRRGDRDRRRQEESAPAARRRPARSARARACR